MSDPDSVSFPSDHQLMGLIRKRVEEQKPMTSIADELGVDVDDLCDWIMGYREPRNRREDTSKGGPSIRDRWEESGSAQRFLAWRKETMGARKRLGEIDREREQIFTATGARSTR